MWQWQSARKASTQGQKFQLPSAQTAQTNAGVGTGQCTDNSKQPLYCGIKVSSLRQQNKGGCSWTCSTWLSLADSPDVKYKHECSVRRVIWQKQPGWVSVSKGCYRTAIEGREGQELMHEGKEPSRAAHAGSWWRCVRHGFCLDTMAAASCDHCSLLKKPQKGF